jgi:lipopolysaccharide biosynthesis glycosyltransferase
MAVYTMFRGERAQLLQWCSFHLNAGADRLFVVLDCASPDLVSSLPAHSRIHWEATDQQTWDAFYPAAAQNVERKQVDGFRWAARRAASEGQGWLAFLDADELLWLPEPFADIAGRFPDAPAITVPGREMWYDESDPTTEPFAATLGVRKSSARGVLWTRAFGWRAQFLRNGLLGHDAGKSVYRLPVPAGEITVHRPRTSAMATASVTLPSSHGGLLHFDSGSVATWNAKWGGRAQGDTLATGLGPQRRAQQRLFSRELRKTPDSQEQFFAEFFSLSRQAQGLLEAEGILERLDVREAISDPLALSPARGDAEGAALIRLPEPADRVDFQFALVCDRRFVRPTFATMTAVLAHMGELGSVRFVVLGDGLGPEDVSHLLELRHTAYDVRVVVHDVTSDLDRDVGTEDAKRATFGRIYLVDYLPEQRTVYLDGDVLPTRSFAELFDLDLGVACLAGAPDSAALRLVADPALVPVEQRNRLMGITKGRPLEYLNGGVLVLDLDNPDFRTLALQARSLVVMHGRALKQRDQDAMNIAFAERKYQLDSRYNYMTQFYVSDRCLEGDLVRRKYDAADASLIHFSGKTKPWDTEEEEFYNGMYRRLVADAERRVGVSCQFYFSQPPRPPRHGWTAERWVEALRSPAVLSDVPEPRADITVVDLDDDGAHLALSCDMYELALAEELRLAAYAHGTTLFEAPLDRLSAPRAHLRERVAPGLRRLPVDLVEALAPCGGVAHLVELAVTRAKEEPGFVRLVGGVDLLAAGSAATSDLLPSAGVDGAVEALTDGWLTGWFRSRAEGSEESVSLYVDGDLVALRPPDLPRPDLSPASRAMGFRFDVQQLWALGYGHDAGRVTVRVSGTNIPLRGGELIVSDPCADLRFDPVRDSWVEQAHPRPSVLRRVRDRVRRLR